MEDTVNGMSTRPTHSKETITQFRESNLETQEAINSILNFDFSEMRTHRLPEDDEGMDETNQRVMRMPQAILDQLDGKTPDNPEGTSQIVYIRLSNVLIKQLKAYGLNCERGYQSIIEDVLEDFAKNNSL